VAQRQAAFGVNERKTKKLVKERCAELAAFFLKLFKGSQWISNDSLHFAIKNG